MNYIRRAAGTVGSAASYLPVVGSYFSGANAPAANNTTRRNRPANAAAPAPAPVAAVNVPAVNVAAPAAVPAAEGAVARAKRLREEEAAARRAAVNANKAAAKSAFLKPNAGQVVRAGPGTMRVGKATVHNAALPADVGRYIFNRPSTRRATRRHRRARRS